MILAASTSPQRTRSSITNLSGVCTERVSAIALIRITLSLKVVQKGSQDSIECFRLFDIREMTSTRNDFQSRPTNFPMHQLGVFYWGEAVFLANYDQSRRDYS